MQPPEPPPEDEKPKRKGRGKNKPQRELPPLSGRRLEFVRQYLIAPNGKQAAIAAGYAPGKHGKNAETVAANLLRDDRVADMIAREQERRGLRTEITADKILHEIAAIALFNPKDVLDEKGNPLPMHKIPDQAAKAISSMRMTTHRDGTVRAEYKFHDKSKALEAAGKHFGMFVQRHEVDVNHRLAAMDYDELHAEFERLSADISGMIDVSPNKQH